LWQDRIAGPAESFIYAGHWVFPLDPFSRYMAYFVTNRCHTRNSLRMQIVCQISIPSKSQVVVHRNRDLLLRTKISFRRLDRGVAEEKFDLLQVAAILAA
jgi:hypothetical protein